MTERTPTIPTNQQPGGERVLTDAFRKMRDTGTREHARGVERLKNRVSSLLAGPTVPGMSWEKFEQTVVPWQREGDVSSCPLCSKEFSLLSNRKTHCRLCGLVRCQKPGAPSSNQPTCQAKQKKRIKKMKK